MIIDSTEKGDWSLLAASPDVWLCLWHLMQHSELTVTSETRTGVLRKDIYLFAAQEALPKPENEIQAQ